MAGYSEVMEALKGPVLVEVDVSKLMGSESFSGGARKLERSSVAVPPSIDSISGSVRRKGILSLFVKFLSGFNSYKRFLHYLSGNCGFTLYWVTYHLF